MSYLVLARKYRPQSFGDVVKQDHVTRTLANAIESERVSHALLFSGPRGTGKTTVARIMAKAMNCRQGPTPTPCNQCSSCREITSGSASDVFEIDGASNNGVDHIRDLRENAKYLPATSPYKIYIIDEVHMLSTPAFNALLKTLEEPPPHVMFFFATTEPQKIPITILSRCQRHDFKRIDLQSIVMHMKRICETENVDISEESLAVIAREAGGSMRDGLSLLDQVLTCSRDSITLEHVLDILGVIDRKMIFDLAEAVLIADLNRLFDLVDKIYEGGFHIKTVYGHLIEHFRNLLLVKIGKNVTRLVDLPEHEIGQMKDQVREVSENHINQILDVFFKEENTVRFSSQPKIALEMVFVRLFYIRPALPIDDLIQKLDEYSRTAGSQPFVPSPEPVMPMIPAENKITSSPEKKRKTYEPAASDMTPLPDEKEDIPANGIPPSESETKDDTPVADWEKIVKIFSEKNKPALAASLARCQIKELADGKITIEVNGGNCAHDRIQKRENLALIKTVISQYFNRDMEPVILFNKNQTDRQQKKELANQVMEEAKAHPLVGATIEIFGGSIVDVKIL